ncbi:hypothetical protein POM88_013645 [Heracleum sosnowskyi]|uniref:ATP-dependent DNA helicase n=1 Tax=Heracleum sosnowskyi TaxID=360622 RepID=A0AAD8J0F7_9APIA|nr:hypothetical protein POM88_013645 [Heracleum sosnowskyi]
MKLLMSLHKFTFNSNLLGSNLLGFHTSLVICPLSRLVTATWISIGDGQAPKIASIEENEPSWVEIPPELSLDPGNDGKKVIIDTIYAQLSNKNDSEYFRDRAILTPLNEDVDLINKEDASQDMIPPILNNMLVTQVEEVQATNVNNAPPQAVNLDEQVGNDNVKNSKDDLAPEDPKAFLDAVNLDEQVGNDNGQNSKDDLMNKRKTPEDQNGEVQPPASSVAKAPIGKQNRNKRKKIRAGII